jgi:hypothetical protein
LCNLDKQILVSFLKAFSPHFDFQHQLNKLSFAISSLSRYMKIFVLWFLWHPTSVLVSQLSDVVFNKIGQIICTYRNTNTYTVILYIEVSTVEIKRGYRLFAVTRTPKGNELAGSVLDFVYYVNN